MAIGGVRAAVDIQDQGIPGAWLESRRLLDPGVDLVPVEAGVLDLLGWSDVELSKELGVQCGQPLRGPGAGLDQEEIAWLCVGGSERGQA